MLISLQDNARELHGVLKPLCKEVGRSACGLHDSTGDLQRVCFLGSSSAPWLLCAESKPYYRPRRRTAAKRDESVIQYVTSVLSVYVSVVNVPAGLNLLFAAFLLVGLSYSYRTTPILCRFRCYQLLSSTATTVVQTNYVLIIV